MSNEILSALSCIPSDCCRDTWFRILASIKTELGDSGKEAARQWSQNSDNYNHVDFEATWRSLQPGYITLGTLIQFAKENGYSPTRNLTSKALHVAKPLYMATQRNTKSNSPTYKYAQSIWTRLDASDPLQELPIAPARLDQYVSSHPYCRKKGILTAGGAARGKVSGRKIGRDADCIVVPFYAYPEGGLLGVECINSQKKKQAFGPKGGVLILGNDLDNTLPQSVFEGWATGARYVADHGGNACAYIVGGKNNLWPVAEKIREVTGRQVLVRSEVDSNE